MKVYRIIRIFGLLLLFSFFIPYLGWAQLFRFEGGKQPKPGTHAPVITQTFAVERGYYGYIWKIYIQAEDPDGDMLRIASVVDQVGFGHYPTDWIYLKAGHEKQFKGYIQWNTFSSKAPFLSEWTRIELKVSVLDKAGNESNVVVFPFEFISGKQGQYPGRPPAPFDQGDLPRLGYIHIDLYEPTTNTGDGSGGAGL